MPEMVCYRNKVAPTGIFFFVWYRTERMDAGIAVPVLVFRMQMPTYA
jgi:hypothetical protein